MKLKSLILFAVLTCAAFAEQRVVIVNSLAHEYRPNKPDLTEVNRLLSQGWTVVSVAAAAAGANYDNRYFSYVFVLESPKK